MGSTNMSMTLPIDKLVSIIRAFTYEMSCVIQSHKGYVLKYVGDGCLPVITPSTVPNQQLLSIEFAINCNNVIAYFALIFSLFNKDNTLS